MNYKDAIEIIIGYEGGYQTNPKDAGNWTGKGRTGDFLGTKFGISARQYPMVDIPNLTRDEAITIYHRDYWNKIRGDTLPFSVALCVLDFAVNAGVKRSAKTLQRVLETKQDGVIGPKTLSKVYDLHKSYIVEHLAKERIMYYTSLNDFEHFGKGWVLRTIEVTSTALLLRSPT